MAVQTTHAGSAVAVAEPLVRRTVGEALCQIVALAGHGMGAHAVRPGRGRGAERMDPGGMGLAAEPRGSRRGWARVEWRRGRRLCPHGRLDDLGGKRGMVGRRPHTELNQRITSWNCTTLRRSSGVSASTVMDHLGSCSRLSRALPRRVAHHRPPREIQMCQAGNSRARCACWPDESIAKSSCSGVMAAMSLPKADQLLTLNKMPGRAYG